MRAGGSNAPATSGKKQHSKRGCADTATRGGGKTMSQDAAASRRGRGDRATTNHSGRSRQQQQQQPKEEPHPSSEPETTQRQRPPQTGQSCSTATCYRGPPPHQQLTLPTTPRPGEHKQQPQKSPKQRGHNTTRPQQTLTHHNRAGTTQRLGHATATAQPRARKTAQRNTNTATAPPGHAASRHNQKRQQPRTDAYGSNATAEQAQQPTDHEERLRANPDLQERGEQQAEHTQQRTATHHTAGREEQTTTPTQATSQPEHNQNTETAKAGGQPGGCNQCGGTATLLPPAQRNTQR